MIHQISTTWDGNSIDHDPIALTLTSTDDGDLKIHVSAPFFNSPIPPEDADDIGTCPELPYKGLYDYEVKWEGPFYRDFKGKS